MQISGDRLKDHWFSGIHVMDHYALVLMKEAIPGASLGSRDSLLLSCFTGCSSRSSLFLSDFSLLQS